MKQSQLKLYFIIIFSIFGLISCKSESPVIIQAEGVKVDGLKGENSDRSVFFAKDLTELELAGRLSIGSLEDHDFATDPLLIEIESSCQGKRHNQPKHKKTRWQNTAHLDVVHLIANESLLLLDNKDLFCDFTMKVTNSIGSEHTSEIKYIRIKNREQFSNLNLATDEYGHINYQDQKKQQLLNASEDTRVVLNCTDFNYTSESRTPTLAFLLENNLPELELSTFEQKCRLLQEVKNQTYISKLFTLDMPIEKPLIQTRFVGLTQPFQYIEHFNPIAIDITNPNNFDIKIQYQNNHDSLARLSVAYLHQPTKNTFLGTKMERTLTWSTQVESKNINETTAEIIIPSQSTITVYGDAYFHVNCINQPFIDMQFNADDYSPIGYRHIGVGHPRKYSVALVGYNFDISLKNFLSLRLGSQKLEVLPVMFNENQYPVGRKTAPYPYWFVFQNLANVDQSSSYYYLGQQQEPGFFNNALEVSPFGCSDL